MGPPPTCTHFGAPVVPIREASKATRSTTAVRSSSRWPTETHPRRAPSINALGKALRRGMTLTEPTDTGRPQRSRCWATPRVGWRGTPTWPGPVEHSPVGFSSRSARRGAARRWRYQSGRRSAPLRRCDHYGRASCVWIGSPSLPPPLRRIPQPPLLAAAHRQAGAVRGPVPAIHIITASTIADATGEMSQEQGTWRSGRHKGKRKRKALGKG